MIDLEELKNKGVAGLIQTGANADLVPGDKKMTPEVAQALVPKAGSLKGWSQINKTAFTAPAGATAAYQKQKQELENIIRTNPQAAEQSVAMYDQLGPTGYQAMMTSFANQMAANPQFGAAVVKKIDQAPGSLQKYMQDYNTARNNRGLDEFVAKTVGTPAPSTTVTADAAPAPQAPAPAKPGKGQKPAAGKKPPVSVTTAPAAKKSEPKEEILGGPEKVTVGATEPKQELEKFLADPKNKKFAEMIDKHNLRGDMIKAAEADPTRLNNLHDAGMMTNYAALLGAGRTQEFMNQFAPDTPDVPATTMAGLGGGLGGLGDMLKNFLGPQNGGMFKTAMDLFTKIGASMGAGGGGVYGSGLNMTALGMKMNTVEMTGLGKHENSGEYQRYVHDMGKFASTADPKGQQWAREQIKKMGIDDNDQLKAIREGQASIYHTGVMKNIDGRVVPQASVVRYDTVADASKAIAANAPEMKAPPKVAGSDVAPDQENGAKTFPVKPQTPDQEMSRSLLPGTSGLPV